MSGVCLAFSAVHLVRLRSSELWSLHSELRTIRIRTLAVQCRIRRCLDYLTTGAPLPTAAAPRERAAGRNHGVPPGPTRASTRIVTPVSIDSPKQPSPRGRRHSRTAALSRARSHARAEPPTPDLTRNRTGIRTGSGYCDSANHRTSHPASDLASEPANDSAIEPANRPAIRPANDFADDFTNGLTILSPIRPANRPSSHSANDIQNRFTIHRSTHSTNHLRNRRGNRWGNGSPSHSENHEPY